MEKRCNGCCWVAGMVCAFRPATTVSCNLNPCPGRSHPPHLLAKALLHAIQLNGWHTRVRLANSVFEVKAAAKLGLAARHLANAHSARAAAAAALRSRAARRAFCWAGGHHRAADLQFQWGMQ